VLFPSGPIANIQHNVQDVASSMGCNIDLQITHSKVMWRMLTEPYVQVVQEIVVSPDTLQFADHVIMLISHGNLFHKHLSF